MDAVFAQLCRLLTFPFQLEIQSEMYEDDSKDNQPVCIHAYKARAMPQTLNAFGCLLISLMPSVAVHRIVGIIPTIT